MVIHLPVGELRTTLDKRDDNKHQQTGISAASRGGMKAA